MRPVAAPPPEAVSPWQSPVPYLFGGLAAMMGLIALALLILACSYWKLDDYLGTGSSHHSSSGAASGAGEGDGYGKSPAVFKDVLAVVMAGEKVPTFLAAARARRLSVVDDRCSPLSPPPPPAGEGSP
ncbi:hypothetical protein GUJ93_ZPchr0010g7687 [Zizania palustris]|uniref:Uncharacterized protein n=1 Tax=Zizania palustris TaxID=103762 RepID=A0A8J5WAJ6_ZIZPA|nr:hypothetical protein GUJ93_ZPchr0010g7687 [Zizania palustris]